VPVDQITIEDIERYKAQKIRKGLSPNTVNCHLCVLRQCLDAAKQEGHLQEPAQIRRLHPVPSRFDVLSPEETAHLLSDRSDRPVAEMVFLAVHTGLRVGELLALTWNDVDLENKAIVVRQ
jgi:integrase